MPLGMHSTEGRPEGSPADRRFVAAIACLGVAMLVAGCAKSPRPPYANLDKTPVSSIRPVAATKSDPPVATSDWETIRRSMTPGLFATPPTSIDWANAETGSNGTISPLAEVQTNGAVSCRAFTTTLSDVRGVRRYRGEACRQPDASWRIGDLVADDAILS